jgi:hypothetical protein
MKCYRCGEGSGDAALCPRCGAPNPQIHPLDGTERELSNPLLETPTVGEVRTI